MVRGTCSPPFPLGVPSHAHTPFPRPVPPRARRPSPPGNWDRKFKRTTVPSAALRGYRVAVTVDDDNGPLARSAGADVLALHGGTTPAGSRAAFAAWWDAQKRRAVADKRARVGVSSSSKRADIPNQWFKDDEDVRFTSAKNIAKAITGNSGEGDLLLDTKKEVIEKPEGWDRAAASDGTSEEDDVDTAPAAEATTATDEVPEKSTNEASESTRDKSKICATADDGDDEPDPCRGEDMPTTKSRKRRQEEEARDTEAAEEEPERTARRQKRGRHGDVESEAADARVEEEAAPEAEADEAAAAPAAAAEERRAGTREVTVDETRRRRQAAESSSDDEPGPPAPAARLSLPVAEDGWLVAAPRRRRAYRQEIVAEGEEKEDNVPASAAETEKVSGLIVRKYVPPTRGAGDRSGVRGRKRKDFKGCKQRRSPWCLVILFLPVRLQRFPSMVLSAVRKNSVLRGYTSFNPGGRRPRDDATPSLPEIRLVDVMPKETERQRMLQQQHEELEREQELADQLFNDTGGRRRGGGNMLSYLSQSTKKKGRGRR